VLILTTGLRAAAAAAEPVAHNPCYDRKDLWPEDVQKTAYYKETWPKAPLYVWTVPGDKSGKGPATDPRDPANWLVDGKRPSAPPGEDCDVLFPQGSGVRLQEDVRLSVRHLTVGEGVRVPKPLKIRPLGNVWIKPGGRVEEVATFGGPKNVFLRNDNRDWLSQGAGLANKIVFNKPIGASIEILGAVKAWDEIGFFCGTVIVGPDAALVPGNRSVQCVYPDARLVLMSGSSFHKRGNQPYSNDLVVAGELLAGTPDRPLTRDCTLGLSFKTKGQAGIVNNPNPGGANDYGMVVNPGGKVLVYSADPKKARLVITWNGLNSNQHQEAGGPDSTPRHVDLVLQGRVDLDGVLFDHIRAGGILVADSAVRGRGVLAFGDHNEGGPDQLFKVLEKPVEAKLVYSSASVPKPASQGGGGSFNPDENR
jgi:hypothetical protein